MSKDKEFLIPNPLDALCSEDWFGLGDVFNGPKKEAAQTTEATNAQGTQTPAVTNTGVQTNGNQSTQVLRIEHILKPIKPRRTVRAAPAVADESDDESDDDTATQTGSSTGQ